ncbi:cation transporter [Bordetella petrii]|nr:cation transporter [Bordetella petrii]
MTDGTTLFDLRDENGVLRASIAVGLSLAVVGIAFGLVAGSFLVLFDGFFSLVDVGVSLLTLVVVKLITAHAISGTLSQKWQERFSMGFWHLEPMVIGLYGMMLIGTAVYALFNAIASLLAGGRDIAFGWAIVYAVITLVASVAIAVVEHRANRRLKSELINLDVQAWIMSAAITAALLVAFVFAYFIQGTAWHWVSPYVDPAVLAIVCVIVIPIPIPSLRQALNDILMITPPELRNHVDEAAARLVQQHGFVTYRAYTARVGRSKNIEIYFIVPPDAPARKLPEWDQIRKAFGEAVGADDPHIWLTVVFTCDMEYADPVPPLAEA